jgi:hypothetical protein
MRANAHGRSKRPTRRQGGRHCARHVRKRPAIVATISPRRKESSSASSCRDVENEGHNKTPETSQQSFTEIWLLFCFCALSTCGSIAVPRPTCPSSLRLRAVAPLMIRGPRPGPLARPPPATTRPPTLRDRVPVYTPASTRTRLPATCVYSPSCRRPLVACGASRRASTASLLRFVDDSPTDDSPTDVDTMSLLTGLDASAAAATRSLDFAPRVDTAISISPDDSPLSSELKDPPVTSPVRPARGAICSEPKMRSVVHGGKVDLKA